MPKREHESHLCQNCRHSAGYHWDVATQRESACGANANDSSLCGCGQWGNPAVLPEEEANRVIASVIVNTRKRVNEMEVLRGRIRAESGPSHHHGRWVARGRIGDCRTCYPETPRVRNTETGEHVYYDGAGGDWVHEGGFKFCSIDECEALYEKLRADPNIVDCDQECQAKTDPQGLGELEDALEHWRDHSYTGGCAHGS